MRYHDIDERSLEINSGDLFLLAEFQTLSSGSASGINLVLRMCQ